MIEQISSTVLPGEETQVSTTAAQKQKSEFLQLLVAQIKGQDPMNPMDGTQFVTQLAQFTSLEELINIRQVMENVDRTMEQQNALLMAHNDDSAASDAVFGTDEN